MALVMLNRFGSTSTPPVQPVRISRERFVIENLDGQSDQDVALYTFCVVVPPRADGPAVPAIPAGQLTA
ncbi:hypothetical protein ACFQ0X_12540 [Streptomyces rectiviolaceus]|uniref:Uncharacterized protein n=1 Tax=Streptomyces rectiviolaceus TaxID=332591 RepID=A0ABP6MVK4_9ACTN